MKKNLVRILFISVSLVISQKAQALTLREYSLVEQKIRSYYQSFEKRKELKINAFWNNNVPNAYTKNDENKIDIYILGGFLKSRLMTKNVLALVLCHELGHHMGGYPFGLIQRRGSNDDRPEHDLSNEGQADFWAANNCMWEVLDDKKEHFYINQKCLERFRTEEQRSLCQQIINAGKSYVNLVKNILNLNYETTVTANATRNLYVGEYPSLDCRRETYRAGALKRSNRPKCWYYEH